MNMVSELSQVKGQDLNRMAALSRQIIIWPGPVLIVNNVWDIVNGSRTRPPPPPVLRLGTSTSTGNADAVNVANKANEEFQSAANRAVCFLAESISDPILLSVHTILADPAATWEKLQGKFARKSVMEHESTQKAFLQFQHQETETAEKTITRFEAVVDRALQQNVAMSPQQIEHAF